MMINLIKVTLMIAIESSCKTYFNNVKHLKKDIRRINAYSMAYTKSARLAYNKLSKVVE